MEEFSFNFFPVLCFSLLAQHNFPKPELSGWHLCVVKFMANYRKKPFGER